MIQASEAIRREIVVSVGQAKAFEVFTARHDRLGPSEHHIGSAPIDRSSSSRACEGGRWYDLIRDYLAQDDWAPTSAASASTSG